MSTMDRQSLIVVGVDGSPASRAALEWAVVQAELTGSPVEAVSVWQWPANYGAPLVPVSDYDPGADATRTLSGVVAPVAQAHPAVEIRERVVHGYAAQALVEAAKDASLLVVGSRGHGELVGVLLGSVSEYCVSHAHCAVVVVKAPDKLVHGPTGH